MPGLAVVAGRSRRTCGAVSGLSSVRYLYSAQACAAIHRRCPEVRLVAGLIGRPVGPWVTRVLLCPAYARAGHWQGSALWLLIPSSLGHLLNQRLHSHGDFAGVAQTALGAQ
jgi:hypothetical protein